MPIFEPLSLSKRAFAKYKPRGLFPELRYAHFRKKKTKNAEIMLLFNSLKSGKNTQI